MKTASIINLKGWKALREGREQQPLKVLTKLSLFSGIGGDDLASEWAGIHTVCFVENNKFCQQILRKHWPDIPIIGDVKDVTKEKVMAYCDSRLSQQPKSEIPAGRHAFDGCGSRGIDIISGGFPCQPHSVAGKHKGSGDERNLWSEFRRVIAEIKPRWVVAENVPGLYTSDRGHFFGSVIADLASLGYSVGWCTFGAVDVGAWHRRDRIFIVAHSNQFRLSRQSSEGERGNGAKQTCVEVESCIQHSPIAGLPDWAGGEMGQPSPLTEFERPDGTTEEREVECNFRGVAHGISRRVDRLRALGNAVVPQQIALIYEAIAAIEGRVA